MEVILSLAALAAVALTIAIVVVRYRAWLAANTTPLATVVLTVLLTAAFLVLFYATPGTEIGAEQPIPFSHRVHSGVKEIHCRYCHPYVERSTHPGLPPVEKCLHCHNYIIAGHPQILKEHAYYDTQTATPWIKVNYLAEHVLFNHQRHIKKQVQCQECHGAVQTMDRIRGKYFYMQFCIDCHRQRNVNLGCWLACHS